MEKKNFMFHKDCPLSDKRKLYLVLHHEMCSQVEDNLFIFPVKPNLAKINPNWDYHNLNPKNSSPYNFPDCENCTMNVIWGYSGYSGCSGVSGYSQEYDHKLNIIDKFKIWLRYLWRIFEK